MKPNLASSASEILNNLSDEFESAPLISNDTIFKIQQKTGPSDAEFDQIYPPRMRAISDIQWSSIPVAHFIAEMIGKDSNLRFVDIGSGIGKLCTLLAYLTKLEITGIEQRRNLFEISERIALENSLKRVRYICGNMLDLNWSDYDVFYLFNPFQEHISVPFGSTLIDTDIDLDPKYYNEYVGRVFDELTQLAPGKKVITFHGYGGDMPSSLKLITSRPAENGHICMWERETNIEKA